MMIVDADRYLADFAVDFDESPHLLALEDADTGRGDLLRTMARTITDQFTPREAQIIVVDPSRRLHDAVPVNQLLGYARSGDSLTELLSWVVPVLRARVPGPDVAPERLSRRDWWTGARVFVLIDEYHLIGRATDSPVAPLVDLLAQGREIGLHVVVSDARDTAIAGADPIDDPLIRRMRELGSPAVLSGAHAGPTVVWR